MCGQFKAAQRIPTEFLCTLAVSLEVSSYLYNMCICVYVPQGGQNEDTGTEMRQCIF